MKNSLLKLNGNTGAICRQFGDTNHRFRRWAGDQKRIVPDTIVELPSKWFVALNSV
jgi:hypothetical protein